MHPLPFGDCGHIHGIERHFVAYPKRFNRAVAVNFNAVYNPVARCRGNKLNAKGRNAAIKAAVHRIAYAVALQDLQSQRIGHIRRGWFSPKEGETVPVDKVGGVGNVLQIIEIIAFVDVAMF